MQCSTSSAKTGDARKHSASSTITWGKARRFFMIASGRTTITTCALSANPVDPLNPTQAQTQPSAPVPAAAAPCLTHSSTEWGEAALHECFAFSSFAAAVLGAGYHIYGILARLTARDCVSRGIPNRQSDL